MQINKILIFRPDNIGDVVLFSGTLKYLRERFATSYLVLAVQPSIRNLVELCPYVDKIITIDSFDYGKAFQDHYVMAGTVRAARRLLNAMRPEFSELVIPLKSPTLHHLVLIRDLAPRIIWGIGGCYVNAPAAGFPQCLAPPSFYDHCMDISKIDPWVHELKTTFDFLRWLGCPVRKLDDIRPEVFLSIEDRSFAKLHMPTKRPVIGIFPGTADQRKSWQARHFGDVVRRIKGKQSVVLFGSESDKGVCLDVASSLRNHDSAISVIDLVGKTTLRQLYACIMSCDLLLTTDSAAVHLGITADIPTVVIAGGAHAGRFIPWGNEAMHRVVTNRLDCFGCNWKCRFPTFECIEKITVEQVLHAVHELVGDLTWKPKEIG